MLDVWSVLDSYKRDNNRYIYVAKINALNDNFKIVSKILEFAIELAGIIPSSTHQQLTMSL